jgi:catechol 2,3-dioxygenase-like lactoylglutathione lyase family enzyme
MAEEKAGKLSFGKLQHIGVVVKDINKAIEYLETLGLGPFGMPGAPEGSPKTFTVPFKGELHGKPAEWKTTITFAKIGDVELEMLEPTEGAQALKESLDETGEGLHHLGYMTDDLDDTVAYFKDKGVGTWTIARQDNGGGFLYTDPSPIGGIALEFRKMGEPS